MIQSKTLQLLEKVFDCRKERIAMAKEKMKVIGDRFLARDYFLNEDEFQKAVEEVEQKFRKNYIGYEIEVEDLKRGVFIAFKDSPQTAERREVIEKLFSELKEYVPNWRTAPQNSTARELEQYYDAIFAEKISFDNVWAYIKHHPEGLKLKQSEVPTGLWFALILFGIDGIRRFGLWEFTDKKIFDVSDDKTDKKLSSIEKLLKLRTNCLIFHMKREYFFWRIVEIRDFLELLEKTDF